MTATRQRWLRELTHGDWETKPAADLDGNRLVASEIDGNFLSTKSYHGIEAHGALSISGATLTIAAPVKYWWKGHYHESATPITATIPTPVSGTLYFLYFADATGTLTVSTTAWDIKDHVLVATVHWNGSLGAVVDETHSHTRDLDWHISAHSTIGARYYSGLDRTTPSVATPGAISITSGVIYDEDIRHTIGAQSYGRLWYKTDASTYTWADTTLPYLGTSGAVQYLDTDTYLPAAVGNNNFTCLWVYAAGDIERPIYIIPTHASAAYNTLALARAETPPALAGFGLTAELKLLYRWIYKGNGDFQESADYRTSSSLPSGFIASTTATAVSFVPTGTVAATNVQAAIEELDTEKSSITHKATHETGGSDALSPVDIGAEPTITKNTAFNKEFATTLQATTGTADDVVMSPATTKAVLQSPPAIGATTPAAGKFTSIELTNGQIKFPVTQLASDDPNTLDDYEEGTFTPVYKPFTGAFDSITYVDNTGYYVKMGKVVYIRGYIRTSSVTIGTAADHLLLEGLPFAGESGSIFASQAARWNSASAVPTSAYPASIYFRIVKSGEDLIMVSDMQTGVSSNSNQVEFTGFYFV